MTNKNKIDVMWENVNGMRYGDAILYCKRISTYEVDVSARENISYKTLEALTSKDDDDDYEDDNLLDDIHEVEDMLKCFCLYEPADDDKEQWYRFDSGSFAELADHIVNNTLLHSCDGINCEYCYYGQAC